MCSEAHLNFTWYLWLLCYTNLLQSHNYLLISTTCHLLYEYFTTNKPTVGYGYLPLSVFSLLLGAYYACAVYGLCYC